MLRMLRMRRRRAGTADDVLFTRRPVCFQASILPHPAPTAQHHGCRTRKPAGQPALSAGVCRPCLHRHRRALLHAKAPLSPWAHDQGERRRVRSEKSVADGYPGTQPWATQPLAVETRPAGCLGACMSPEDLAVGFGAADAPPPTRPPPPLPRRLPPRRLVLTCLARVHPAPHSRPRRTSGTMPARR